MRNNRLRVVSPAGTCRMLLKSRKNIAPIYAVTSLVGLMLYSLYVWMGFSAEEQRWQETVSFYTKDMVFNENYLDPPFNLSENGWIVNTSYCRIPNISVSNREVEPKQLKYEDSLCEPVLVTLSKSKKKEPYFNGSVTGLFIVKKQELVLNETVLQPLNLTWKDVQCVYQSIHRVEQNITHYTGQADNKIWFSRDYPINATRFRPHYGFLKVHCKSVKKGELENVTVYSDFHLLAIIPSVNSDNSSTTKSLARKLEFWRKCRSTDNVSQTMCGNLKGRPPPSVLLIGIESTSRLNFRRQLPRLSNWLEKYLGMVEMRGYTKVGENTFPNFVPLLTSHFVEELKPTCMQNYSNGRLQKAMDYCPFIWKQFSRHHYATAHVEDGPGVQIFHYLKTGFVHSPVDFYPRPWAKAAYALEEANCVSGSQRSDQALLQYMVDLIELLSTHQVPFFITSWITQLTHYNINKLQFMGGVLYKHLTYLKSRGLLDNTLLIITSDHAYRYGASRRCVTGWYEDKLPTLWIRVPETLEKALPLWKESVEYNGGQLSTPFDLHATFKSLLNANQQLRRRKVGILEGNGMRGLSLFRKLPDRTCEQAGVPPEYCACVPPTPYSGKSDIVKTAATKVMTLVNGQLSFPNCTILRVYKVTAFALMCHQKDLASMKEEKKSQLEVRVEEEGLLRKADKVVIGINTIPGDINIEAWLQLNSSTGALRVINSSLPYGLYGDRDCIVK